MIREYFDCQEERDPYFEKSMMLFPASEDLEGAKKQYVCVRQTASLGDFLTQSELTETKAFIQSFVKEIAVAPGQAIVRYAMPMPEDSPIGRRESEVVRIGEPVLATVHDGWGWRIRTSAA